MLKKILIAVIALGPIAVFAQSQIINSWSDPNPANPNHSVHKVVIAALINNQVTRRNVEDYVASLYPGTATPSYEIIGDSLISNEAAVSRQLKNRGFDGIIMMKQTGQDDQQQYIPGRPGTNFTTWSGYWSRWGPHPVNHWVPGTPGHTENIYTWYVQVNVFSLNNNALLYSANTSTTKPGGTIPLFEDVSNAVKTQLSANGIF